jgi:hypothetical protein
VASRERIDRYRASRPGTLLSDDMIAWELDHAPDCAAEVPTEFKAELEWAADDDGLPILTEARTAVARAAPKALYDYASAPHGGRWKPLPDHGHEPNISPRVHVHHSIVGSGAGAWSYFANSTSVESTNIVLKSGELWQIMARTEQADANYKANAFAISTETEDNGNPNTDPWTGAQLDTLVWLTLEDMRDFGIPRRVCPAWDAGGVGYHSMWGTPSQWTPSVKTCPGTIRIRQWTEVVVPRVLGQLQEADLTEDQARQLKAVYDALTVPGTTSPEQTVNLLFERVRRIEQALTVPGTTSAEETVNLLFARIRDIHTAVMEPPA